MFGNQGVCFNNRSVRCADHCGIFNWYHHAKQLSVKFKLLTWDALLRFQGPHDTSDIITLGLTNQPLFSEVYIFWKRIHHILGKLTDTRVVKQSAFLHTDVFYFTTPSFAKIMSLVMCEWNVSAVKWGKDPGTGKTKYTKQNPFPSTTLSTILGWNPRLFRDRQAINCLTYGTARLRLWKAKLHSGAHRAVSPTMPRTKLNPGFRNSVLWRIAISWKVTNIRRKLLPPPSGQKYHDTCAAVGGYQISAELALSICRI